MSQHLGMPAWAFAAALAQLEGMTPKKLRIALLHEEPEDAWARAMFHSTKSEDAVALIQQCCERENIQVVYIQRGKKCINRQHGEATDKPSTRGYL